MMGKGQVCLSARLRAACWEGGMAGFHAEMNLVNRLFNSNAYRYYRPDDEEQWCNDGFVPASSDGGEW